MSNETCLNVKQFTSKLNNLGDLLMEHYNKNIETTLNSEDEELLNKITDKLQEISTGLNVEFNKDGFKNVIKRLFVYDFAQFGGKDDIDNQIVPYSEKSSQSNQRKIWLPNKYDFLAIVSFCASLYLLFLAYNRFISLTSTITQSTPNQLSERFQDEMETIIDEIKKLEIGNLSFIQFVFQSIQSLGCSFVSRRQSEIISGLSALVNTILSNSYERFKFEAENLCIYKDNTMLSELNRVITSFISPKTQIECIAQAMQISQKSMQNELSTQIDRFILVTKSETLGILDVLSYAYFIGMPSALYLIARTKQVVELKTNSRLAITGSEDIPRITETGGKKRYTKKNKKHRKTAKKRHVKIYKKKSNKKRKH